MTYDEIANHIQQLGYRDKFRLAQLLVQLARKEEEEQNLEHRAAYSHSNSPNQETIQYVVERILKLKPAKRSSLLNSIGAMFQFRGGISESDKEKIVSELREQRYIDIIENDRVCYLRS